MTDGEALLKAIIDCPDDDFPRLAMADWLDENGQERRAEFIRVQLTEPNRLGKREAYLIDLGRRLGWFNTGLLRAGFGECQHLCWWFDTGARVEGNPLRGFVDEVHCPLQAWLDHGPAIVAAHPVRKVTLSDRKPIRNVHGLWRDDADADDLSGERWGWFVGIESPAGGTAHSVNLGFALPPALFRLLPPGLPASPGVWACESEDDANAVLSSAALILARQPARKAASTAS